MPQPRSRDLRRARWSETHRPYLCTTTVQNRDPVFSDLYVGRLVVDALRFSDSQRWTSTLAFVVMPDHLHWMFELTGPKSLSRVLSSVKRRSARAVNKRLGRRGQLWQDGFHDHAIRREEALENVWWYVVLNPVRANLVESIGDYSLWDGIWI